MKKRIRSAVSILLLIGILLLSACSTGTRSLPLGEGIPAWEISRAKEIALPADADAQGLYAAFHSDAEHADYFLYRYEKTGTLEEIGQAQSAEHNVFCNWMTHHGIPAANFVYAEETGLVQAYLYEGEDAFIKVCVAYESDAIPLGKSEYTFRLPNVYRAKKQADSGFSPDMIYQTKNEDLPTVIVRQFAKDAFPEKCADADWSADGGEQYAAYAADGWTAEELIALYGDAFDLLRGEVLHRNGLEAAFLGYIDDGVFKVRAFIDAGADFIMLGAEDDAANFRHVVNALMDTIC